MAFRVWCLYSSLVHGSNHPTDMNLYVLGEAVLLEGAVGRAENNPMLQTLQAGTHNIIRGHSSLSLNLGGGRAT
jgi:hypothetical protein